MGIPDAAAPPAAPAVAAPAVAAAAPAAVASPPAASGGPVVREDFESPCCCGCCHGGACDCLFVSFCLPCALYVGGNNIQNGKGCAYLWITLCCPEFASCVVADLALEVARKRNIRNPDCFKYWCCALFDGYTCFSCRVFHETKLFSREGTGLGNAAPATTTTVTQTVVTKTTSSVPVVEAVEVAPPAPEENKMEDRE